MYSNNSGLECVVDNHTLQNNLRKVGWKVGSRAVTKERGSYAGARLGHVPRVVNMVRRMVERILRQRSR